MGLLGALRLGMWGLWQYRVRRMPPRQIEALQRKRFRRLLGTVLRQSAFYRSKFRGLNPFECRLDQLPTTNKHEMMAEFDRVVTDPRITRRGVEEFIEDSENASKLYLGQYPVCQTSGSSGQPALIVKNRLCLEVLFALQFTRGNPAFHAGPMEFFRRLTHPGRLAVIALDRGFYPSAVAWEHMPAGFRSFVRVLRLAPSDPHLIDRLNAFRPTVLTAYASVLEALLLHQGQLRLAPELQQVVNSSETLSDRQRAQLSATFHVPILDNYSSGECGFLTTGCPTNPGAHINADWVIVEVVDEENRPVRPGELGAKILITNLVNDVQPFIRYELNDRIAMATAACDCGNLLPRIERIEGRTADFFWVRSQGEYRPLLGTVFNKAFDFFHDIREWQAIQEERDLIRVKIEMLPERQLDEGRCRQALERQFEEHGCKGVRVEINVVRRLDSDATTGKFRRCISRLGLPNEVRDLRPCNARGTPI